MSDLEVKYDSLAPSSSSNAVAAVAAVVWLIFMMLLAVSPALVIAAWRWAL